MLPSPYKSYGSYDWTCLGYKNNTSPLIRHGFMGVIKDSSIDGKWFSDITQATHGDVSYTQHCARFRYLPYYKNGTIVWTDDLDMTENNIKLAECFIYSKKWPLGGKVDGQVQIIDSLLEEKFGSTPIYNKNDVPKIPRRM